MHGQRLRHPQVAGREAAREPGGRRGVAYFTVMSIGRLHRTEFQRDLRHAPSASLCAQLEQVARRVVKKERAAVNHLMLEKTGRIPSCELLLGEIADLPANSRLHILLAEREIQQNPAHPFALELQGAVRLWGERGLCQRFPDMGRGSRELSRIDLGDNAPNRRWFVQGSSAERRRAEQRTCYQDAKKKGATTRPPQPGYPCWSLIHHSPRRICIGMYQHWYPIVNNLCCLCVFQE